MSNQPRSGAAAGWGRLAPPGLSTEIVDKEQQQPIDARRTPSDRITCATPSSCSCPSSKLDVRHSPWSQGPTEATLCGSSRLPRSALGFTCIQSTAFIGGVRRAPRPPPSALTCINSRLGGTQVEAFGTCRDFVTILGDLLAAFEQAYTGA